MGEESLQQTNEESIIQKCLSDNRYFIETFFTIVNKDRNVVPFLFNSSQDRFYSKIGSLHNFGINRYMINKPRQLGFSTLICALWLCETILVPNTRAIIIAHDKKSTENIFRITLGMFERLPKEIQPERKFSTKTEIEFKHLNSRIEIGTAGSGDFGRGATVNLLHCSEYAFWDNPSDVLAGLIQAVPKSGKIIYETTCNGYNHFYDEYNEAKKKTEQEMKMQNIPYPFFFRWFEHDEYRFDNMDSSEVDYIKQTLSEEEKEVIKAYELDTPQIAWRRAKQQELKNKFPQEYPEDDFTCFVSSGRPFFDPKILKSIILWNEANKTWDRMNEEGDVVLEKGWIKKEADGLITIYKNFIPGEQYILCVDPAEGNPNSDNSSAFVLRLNKDPVFVEECAEISDTIPMPKFWRLIYHLGALYNFPRLVIERNNHGHLLNYWAVNGFLQDQVQVLGKYPKVYFAKDNKAGFVTTSATRPLILDNSAEMLRNNMYVCYSRSWLHQALTFVYNDNGRPEADKGKKDDSVIAKAIGTFILVHEKQNSGFQFLNKDDFQGGSRELPKGSVYDNKRTVLDNLHPTDVNITLDETAEIINWEKYIY